MIYPIFSRNFGNNFHHKNGTNQCQNVHKPTGQQYQYLSIYTPITSSITHLKEDCHGCGLNINGARELSMQYYGKWETRPFGGLLFIKKNKARKYLPQNNHEHGLILKGFNKNNNTSKSAPPKATIARHKPKINSVNF